MTKTLFRKPGIGGAFLLALALIVAVNAVAWLGMDAMLTSARWENHTHLVIQQWEELLSAVKDVETGKRGFLITGEEQYLVPYDEALALVDRKLASLKDLTRDNPRQQNLLAGLEPLIRQKISETDRSIDLRRTEGFQATYESMAAGRGKILMDEIRRLVADAQGEESRLLQERMAASAAGARKMQILFLLGGLLSLLLLLAVFHLLRREIVQRRKAEEEVRKANEQLEARVGERTAELHRVNTALKREIAERLQKEEALRQSVGRLSLALDSAAAGIWEWDVRTDENFWSEELWKLFRLAPFSSTPSFEVWRQIVHHEDANRVEQAVREAAERGAEIMVEWRLRATERPERWLLSLGRPVRDRDGRVVSYAGIVLDITERKRGEVETRRQSKLLRGINRIFEEALRSGTTEALGVTCLEVAEEITESRISFVGEIGPDGLLHDIAISNPGWDACAMTDQSGHRRPPGDFKVHGIYGRVLADGKGFYTNDPASHPDRIGLPPGHPPVESFLGVPLFTGGQIVGMFGVGNREGGYGEDELRMLEALASVTAEAFLRKRAEEAVRESEERLLLAQKVAHIGTFEWNIQTGVNRWTPELEEMYGLRPGGFCGTEDAFEALVHPEDRPEVVRRVDEAMDTGTFEGEFRVIRPDGAVRWMFGRAFVFKDESGRPLRLLGVNIDITDRKEEEEVLRNLQVEKEAAELATRAKSEFLANMSHEIRTPMTVFMAAIEHLQQSEADPERRHLLGMAEESAQRLLLLIEDILDFSRMEAGRLEIGEESFAPRDALRRVMEMMEIKARGKGLRLTMEVAPEVPPWVLGDAGRLGQVLINLIGNAVKFTPEGEVSVSVRSRGDLLEFAVIDTGIGIPEEKRAILFESFRQGDSSFTRRYGGTGLGLAISKGLVELMGGEIGVRGREGGGSVFTFTLPLKTVEATHTENAEPTPVPEADLSEVRILVAEDEPAVRDIILMFLARRDCRAEIAGNGAEALRKWKEGEYDLIFMDLQMPELDGLAATRRIRELEDGKGRHTCIVGLTAHARREVLEQCLTAGMDKVLTKPVPMRELFAVIENCRSGHLVEAISGAAATSRAPRMTTKE